MKQFIFSIQIEAYVYDLSYVAIAKIKEKDLIKVLLPQLLSSISTFVE